MATKASRNASLTRISIRLVALALAFVACTARAAAADADAWTLLQRGGQVVLMRHALTTPGAGDPADMRLEDCGTQRNLSDEGRRHARAVGAALREHKVPVDRVLTSPWCRCIETARLVFGASGEVSRALDNLFGRHDNEARQVSALRALAGEWRGKGNLFLVSHGSTILAATGISPDTSEMVIVTPSEGGSFAIAGRLVAHDR
jgi:phosphohistidine phosphatase SixA